MRKCCSVRVLDYIKDYAVRRLPLNAPIQGAGKAVSALIAKIFRGRVVVLISYSKIDVVVSLRGTSINAHDNGSGQLAVR